MLTLTHFSALHCDPPSALPLPVAHSWALSFPSLLPPPPCPSFHLPFSPHSSPLTFSVLYPFSSYQFPLVCFPQTFIFFSSFFPSSLSLISFFHHFLISYSPFFASCSFPSDPPTPNPTQLVLFLFLSALPSCVLGWWCRGTMARLLTELTSDPLGRQSSRLSRSSLMTPQSPMCSETGTENCTLPARPCPGLSGVSGGMLGDREEGAASSLTGMGVASGAGMH